VTLRNMFCSSSVLITVCVTFLWRATPFYVVWRFAVSSFQDFAPTAHDDHADVFASLEADYVYMVTAHKLLSPVMLASDDQHSWH